MTKPATLHTPRIGVLASLAVLLLLTLASTNVAAQTGTLQGTVTDGGSGLPIEHAMVVARANLDGHHPPGHHPRRAWTAEDGTYTIENLPAGDYVVACGKRGYYHATTAATVADGQATVVDFALEPLAFGSVAGVVSDADTGEPIPGARVMLLPPGPDGAESGGHGHWMTAVTGDDGSFLIENAVAGDYSVRARAWGYYPSEPIAVTVVEGEVSVVDFALDPLVFGSLEGTVTDATTGDPIAGARVVLRVPHDLGEGINGGRPGGGWFRTETDDNGFYRFDELVAATYLVRAVAPGFFPAEAEAEVLDGDTTVVDLALDPLTFGSIEGTITDSTTGDPVAGARVVLTRPWGHGTEGLGETPVNGWHHAVTDDSGFYRFDEVVVGTHVVRVFARGYLRAQAEAEVQADQTTVVDLALEPRDGHR